MIKGLKILQFAGGYYGRSVTVVGWLKPIGGDEYLLVNGCTIIRNGQWELGAIGRIAKEGPGDTHRCSAPSTSDEEVHRLLVRRSWQADEQVWSVACPKPAGWDD